MTKLKEYNINNRAEPVSSPLIFLLIAVIRFTHRHGVTDTVTSG